MADFVDGSGTAPGPAGAPSVGHRFWRRALGERLRGWPDIVITEVLLVNVVVQGLIDPRHPAFHVAAIAIGVVGQLWNGYHAWRRLRVS